MRRPDRMFVRPKLSAAGRRKQARLRALGELGYRLVSTRGAGMVAHPDNPAHLYTVAAAAIREGVFDVEVSR